MKDRISLDRYKRVVPNLAALERTEQRVIHGQTVTISVYGPGFSSTKSIFHRCVSEEAARAATAYRRRTFTPRHELCYVGLPGRVFSDEIVID